MKQSQSIAKTLVLLYPFIIVFFIVFSASILTTAPTVWMRAVPAIYGFGFLLFLCAKLSVARPGTPVSSSDKQMSSGYRLLYHSGYLIMVLSVFLTLGLLVARH